ncbi:hypothetical protein QTP86_030318 [Hemibagrus guttatus]|nr:hypothetical protein QTP86_030318 [Hemibagrus guttatus]
MDAPSKFFFSLEQKNGQKRFIHAVRTESGDLLSETTEICKQTVSFYSKLYSSEWSEAQVVEDSFLVGLPKLSERAARELDRELSLEELHEALQRMENGWAEELHWLLEEPLVYGGRLDISGVTLPALSRTIVSSGIVMLRELVNVAGSDLSRAEDLAARMGLWSLRVVNQLLHRWRSALTSEEHVQPMDYQRTETGPAEDEPFPRLNIAPDLDGCAGPLLECRSEGEMDFRSVSGKLLYRACVKVLNKKKLSGRVDTPWRSVLGFNGDIKPEWTHCAPGPPGEPFISRYGAALTIHWTSGDPGRAPISRYVIEARPSDEGLWDILIKDIPKEVTSYTFNMDILRQGVSYDFRIIGVNDYGYGSPSQPSPSVSAHKVAPFYEEWWFLVVMALVGLIFILLLVFILIIRGQSKKYAKKEIGNSPNCTTLTHGEMVGLDESRFPALELNNRRLSVKASFNRKNGIYTRLVFTTHLSPPRPSPGSLHYSDEDINTKYSDLIKAESSSLTEKKSELSDSQGSDSECEGDSTLQNQAHSFVNHYISDPTYYNSWRRQQKGISRAPPFAFSQSEPSDPTPAAVPDPIPATPPSPAHAEPQSLFRPKGSRTPTPSQQSSTHSTLYRPPSSLAPTATPRPPSSLAPPTTPRPPIAGFSSFV